MYCTIYGSNGYELIKNGNEPYSLNIQYHIVFVLMQMHVDCIIHGNWRDELNAYLFVCVFGERVPLC